MAEQFQWNGEGLTGVGSVKREGGGASETVNTDNSEDFCHNGQQTNEALPAGELGLREVCFLFLFLDGQINSMDQY